MSNASIMSESTPMVSTIAPLNKEKHDAFIRKRMTDLKRLVRLFPKEQPAGAGELTFFTSMELKTPREDSSAISEAPSRRKGKYKLADGFMEESEHLDAAPCVTGDVLLYESTPFVVLFFVCDMYAVAHNFVLASNSLSTALTSPIRLLCLLHMRAQPSPMCSSLNHSLVATHWSFATLQLSSTAPSLQIPTP